MTSIEAFQTGKGHRDENFPVASFIISARHRPAILAFYRFVRAADDVADSATASPEEKLRLLDDLRRSLHGEAAVPQGVALRGALAARGLTTQHADDLLEAFGRDVTKLRYRDWDDLIDYCRYSAMPVGRFVLDVHGEKRSLWPLSDALCAALQVINHLQDCAEDFKALNRVYIPLDRLARAKLEPEVLASPRAPAALQAIIADLASRCTSLLDRSRDFSPAIADWRLGLEVSVIQTFAEDLARRLATRDPLSERVHHDKLEALALGGTATARFVAARFAARPPLPQSVSLR